MRISKFTLAFLFLFLISKVSSAAAPEYAKPINAYQKKYDMSFLVWKPDGLNSKWHATYDGYPVTETAKDQWVYGVLGNAGELTESLIAVGSVNPESVHILTPLPSFSNMTGSLWEIFDDKCDNFGIVYTNASFTPIAWESDTLKVYMWNGEKWVQVIQNGGERLSDAVKRFSNIVARKLRADNTIWTQIDTYEFANYARNAGYTWIDNFDRNMPDAFSAISSGNSGSTGTVTGGTQNPGDGGWDTGRN